MINSGDPDILLDLAGFGGWADDLSSETEQDRFMCDVTSDRDIERWFLAIVLPGLRRQNELAEQLKSNFLNLVDNGEFDKIHSQLDGLSPVPFTTDIELRNHFFRQIATLLRNTKTVI